MTRLKAQDVESISAKLFQYDTELISKTGHPLRGIACLAAGVQEDEIKKHLKKVRVGVIPITVGEGVIAGFYLYGNIQEGRSNSKMLAGANM